MTEILAFGLASLGIIFIGISKAGFGGGLGMLTTPICVAAFSLTGKSPAFVVGLLLPLLSAGDLFSIYHYWKKWDAKNLKFLLPGVIVGVCVGAALIGRFSPRQLNLAIGVLAICFVLFQLSKEFIFKLEGSFKPNHIIGIPCGIASGITSTFAHGAGPVVSMFLIPQKLPKQIYVGTTVLVFTWINWIKLPFFFANGIITQESLLTGLKLFAFVPVGVWIGVALNKRIPEKYFLRVVYFLTFCTGIYLLVKES